MCNLRTDLEISKQLQQLVNAQNSNERESLSIDFGLKSHSILCDLPFFSLTKDLLYDPNHIFPEGVALKETTLFLSHALMKVTLTEKK